MFIVQWNLINIKKRYWDSNFDKNGQLMKMLAINSSANIAFTTFTFSSTQNDQQSGEDKSCYKTLQRTRSLKLYHSLQVNLEFHIVLEI